MYIKKTYCRDAMHCVSTSAKKIIRASPFQYFNAFLQISLRDPSCDGLNKFTSSYYALRASKDFEE